MSVPGEESGDNLGSTAVTAVLWTAAQKWIARIGGFVTIAILARLLAPAEFGTVAAATAVLPIAYLLADMGFSTYVVQAHQTDRRMLSTAFWFSIAAGAILAGCLMLAAPLFAVIFNVPEAGAVVQALSPLVLLVTISSVPIALLRRQLRFRALAIQSFIASIIGQVIAIVLAFLGVGVWALVAQMLVFQIVTTIYACLAARWRPSWEFSLTDFTRMASFGVKVVGVDLIGVLRQWAEYAIIGAFLGAAGLGYLNIAQRLVQIAQDVTAAAVLPVSTVVFARIRSEPDRLRSAYGRALGMTYAVIVPVMVFLAVSAPQLIPFLFGDQWGGSIVTAQILACVGVLTMVAMLDHGLFYGVGKPGRWFIFAVGVDAVTLCVALLTAPHGLAPWALGFLAVAVLSTLVRWPLLSRTIGLRWTTVGAVTMRAGLAALVSVGIGVLFAFVSASWLPALSILLVGFGVLGGQMVGLALFSRPVFVELLSLIGSRLRRRRGGPDAGLHSTDRHTVVPRGER